MFTSVKNGSRDKAGEIVLTILRPALSAIHYLRSTTSGIWSGYVGLRGAAAENKTLREQVALLIQERSAMQATVEENRRLKKLLDLKVAHDFPSLAAQVIGEDASGWYRTIILNRGAHDGVVSGMAVTDTNGVVGRVTKTVAGASRVLLLTDPGLSIDCRVARTRDRGVLTGSLESGCVLSYLPLKADVTPGDQVVTSGLDGIFPKDLPVGKIATVRKGRLDLFLEAVVTPSVDISRLEEALIILGPKGQFDIRLGLDGPK